MNLNNSNLKKLLEKDEMITKQMEVMLRENSFMIYQTLVMFGSLRPRDIQKYTNISSGRMYNEIVKLQEVDLVIKQKVTEKANPKSFYSAVKSESLENLISSDYTINDFMSEDIHYRQIFDILFKYITNFPILFQNFISKVANNVVKQYIKSENSSKGDFTTQQKNVRLSDEDYEILRGRILLLIRDLDLNLVSKKNANNHVAVNISLFRYDSQ